MLVRPTEKVSRKSATSGKNESRALHMQHQKVQKSLKYADLLLKKKLLLLITHRLFGKKLCCLIFLWILKINQMFKRPAHTHIHNIYNIYKNDIKL